ncbi:TLD-domain-containing protein [Jimgerdemannia flammicorona]|uniref:Oxidation resistance protein 1 n=1 Tax=Jimgerdemannia flammicorona TaxID=994334 RepID=A0A433A2C9_9FUNG|nr:TLD-domain-containing protein [Jimgerdemannia flammicorona]
MPGPKLADRKEDTAKVIDENIAEQIRRNLPRRYRLAQNWNLLYSLDQHGSSISTLYHRIKGKGPLVLAIKDDDDGIFGAFVNEPFRPNPSYYGTGECFLWKALLSDRPEDAQVRVYPWTGRNDYILLCDSGFIGIGGGDGKFGLWLHSDLERGHSERCVTFDNELLSSSSEFECVQLEVWGFKI